jgi:hypothetical protein
MDSFNKMENIKAYFRLVILFKTPFVYLRANTWRVMQLKVDWSFFYNR